MNNMLTGAVYCGPYTTEGNRVFYPNELPGLLAAHPFGQGKLYALIYGPTSLDQILHFCRDKATIIVIIHKDAHAPAAGLLVARVLRQADVLGKPFVYVGYYPGHIIPEAFPPKDLY
jgi:hypothetical protein